jgi:hypothetical protein
MPKLAMLLMDQKAANTAAAAAMSVLKRVNTKATIMKIFIECAFLR